MLLPDEIRRILDRLVIYPRRLSLQTPGIRATVPMLRGVWGAALHDLDGRAYEAVFVGRGAPRERTPRYILRPAPPDPADAPALEWILLHDMAAYDAILLRAWDVASGMGLGKERHRFHIRATRPLGPGGEALAPSREACGWPVSQARWPLPGDPARTPCRLTFPAPLRVLRRHVLIEQPALPDLVVAALRRLGALLPTVQQQALTALRPALLGLARQASARPWVGRQLDLVRYSARQQVDLELHGVAGYLDLPDGPGELWPLLAAAQWVHLGKGTVVGMGQLVVKPLPCLGQPVAHAALAEPTEGLGDLHR
jgi:hypothetical protein